MYARSPSSSQRPAPTTIASRSPFPLGLCYCYCSTSLSKMRTRGRGALDEMGTNPRGAWYDMFSFRSDWSIIIWVGFIWVLKTTQMSRKLPKWFLPKWIFSTPIYNTPTCLVAISGFGWVSYYELIKISWFLPTKLHNIRTHTSTQVHRFHVKWSTSDVKWTTNRNWLACYSKSQIMWTKSQLEWKCKRMPHTILCTCTALFGQRLLNLKASLVILIR